MDIIQTGASLSGSGIGPGDTFEVNGQDDIDGVNGKMSLTLGPSLSNTNFMDTYSGQETDGVITGSFVSVVGGRPNNVTGTFYLERLACDFNLSPSGNLMSHVGGTAFTYTPIAAVEFCGNNTTSNSLDWVSIVATNDMLQIPPVTQYTYTVARNTTDFFRSGTFTIGGKPFVISQSRLPTCNLRLHPLHGYLSLTRGGEDHYGSSGQQRL